MRNRPTVLAQAPEGDREARALREQVSTLQWLLNEERDRSDDLLEKLLFAMAAAPAGSVVLPGNEKAAREPDWHWPDLQPQDEALADVHAQVREGTLQPEEANAILEALGFPNAEIHTDE